MSWQIVKDLKEKRAKAFADAASLRDSVKDRDLNADEETRHNTLLSEVESFSKRIEREERAMQLGEMVNSHKQMAEDHNEQRQAGVEMNSLGMPAKDFRKYSILRAINCVLNRRPIDGLEGEVNEEYAKRSGSSARGFYIPLDIPMKLQNRTIFDTTQGAGAVPTIVTPNFIEALRNRIVSVGLGATMLSEMVGNFAIPKQNSVATSYWVADGSAPTASYPTVGQVSFSPKTIGAYTDISRDLLKQAVFSAEEFVRNDLARVLALGIENAAFNGTGSSNQPLGIVTNLTTNYSGQVHAIGTNGGAAAFSDMVALETLVAVANADISDKGGYAVNAKTRGTLKITPRASTVVAGFIYEDGTVNGYNAPVTNLLPSNGTKGTGSNLSTAVFGYWDQLVYAMWGGLDLLVDPYTGGSAGTVRIDALQSVDVEVRHPESFSACVDMAE